MRNLLASAFFAASAVVPSYLIFGSHALADDWGCQVILCISNPGGPTQYGECGPPIHKLWNELAKGHPFPTCKSVGVRTSPPGYEPYSCNPDHRLIRRYGVRGQEASCISRSPQRVDDIFCSYSDDLDPSTHGVVTSASWRRLNGQLECFGHVTARPTLRERPQYMDVTVDGRVTQRIWY